MSIPFDTDCILCHLKRNIATARELGTEEQAIEFTKDLMRLYQGVSAEKSFTILNAAVSDLLKERYGVDEDRFKKEKEDSNRFVLSRLDQIRTRVEKAKDSVYAGLQFAILGNYIDFGALQGELSFDQLDELLERGEQMDLDREVYAKLCADLQKGGKLLYLTDNAGEIGFDRVLAEELQKKYPGIQITFCVRGAPALNDATREDAAIMGIPFPVIDNGTRIAGTEIDMLGQEAKAALETADVVIAKGMGNTETMFGCGYNVYYAFLVKCSRFEKVFGKPKFTPMLVSERK
ncbi:MAG: DUF89 family protein [Oscillospiraceae bacterium]|nr:DUF89 family protein [Oscillospiraceae bacterium]